MKLISNMTLVFKLITNKAFRDAHVYEYIRNGVPFQIRAMREERGWTQGKLGELSGKPRNVITRLEDPNYGKLTIKTLLEIASAFEVALLIKFIPFSRLLREYTDTSSAALSVRSITKEKEQLKRWAQIEDRVSIGFPQIENPQLPLPLGIPIFEGLNLHGRLQTAKHLGLNYLPAGITPSIPAAKEQPQGNNVVNIIEYLNLSLGNVPQSTIPQTGEHYVRTRRTGIGRPNTRNIQVRGFRSGIRNQCAIRN